MPPPERAARSVSGDVWCPRSQSKLGVSHTHKWPVHYKEPLRKLDWEQRHIINFVTQEPASIDMARQYWSSDAVQRGGAWLQAKSTQRYEHISPIVADYGRLAVGVRTLCEECEKYLREIVLGLRRPVARTRQELYMLREAFSAWASEVAANREKLRCLGWNPTGCYPGGREVSRAAQAQGIRAQAWDTHF